MKEYWDEVSEEYFTDGYIAPDWGWSAGSIVDMSEATALELIEAGEMAYLGQDERGNEQFLFFGDGDDEPWVAYGKAVGNPHLPIFDKTAQVEEYEGNCLGLDYEVWYDDEYLGEKSEETPWMYHYFYDALTLEDQYGFAATMEEAIEKVEKDITSMLENLPEFPLFSEWRHIPTDRYDQYSCTVDNYNFYICEAPLAVEKFDLDNWMEKGWIWYCQKPEYGENWLVFHKFTRSAEEAYEDARYFAIQEGIAKSTK